MCREALVSSKSEHVTISYIVRALPVSKPTVYEMIKRGEFPAPDLHLLQSNRRFWWKSTADRAIARILGEAVAE